MAQSTFLYFAYGAKLLTLRIHMHIPTAEFVSIARADNYRLNFIQYSQFWGGPTATLVPTANAHVWGVIWRLHKDDSTALNQNTLDINKKYWKHINVLTPYMGEILCRVHVQKMVPRPRGENDQVPVERWPSRAYKEIMVAGAVENQLPPYYIESLKAMKHNGEEGWIRAVCLFDRYARDNKPCECKVPGKIPRESLKLERKDFKKNKLTLKNRIT